MTKRKLDSNSISININNTGQTPQSPPAHNYYDRFIDAIIKVVITVLIQFVS